MIDMLVAYTSKIDNKDEAISDILSKLDLDQKLKKNSVGILTCHFDYTSNEIVKELCGKLPFNVIGITTSSSGASGKSGLTMLSLSVLTSDTASFKAILSEPISPEDAKEVITKAYRLATDGLPTPPSLIIPLMPPLLDVGTETFFQILDQAGGDAPIFGAFACDHTNDCGCARTVFNGDSYKNKMALLAIEGEINPRFFISSISKENIPKMSSVITDSNGATLKEIDNMFTMDYMRSLELVEKDGSIKNRTSLAFIIDYNDSTLPTARAMFMITPEGHVICSGVMPNGSPLTIASINSADVRKTAKEAANKVTALNPKGGMLAFSCVSRSVALGEEAMAELDDIASIMGETPYHAAYVAGELCPVYKEDGKVLNRFHNFTFVACAF